MIGLRQTGKLRQCTNWNVNLRNRQTGQGFKYKELVQSAGPSSWSVKPEDVWRVPLVKELVEINSNHLEVPDFDEEELRSILNYTCSEWQAIFPYPLNPCTFPCTWSLKYRQLLLYCEWGVMPLTLINNVRKSRFLSTKCQIDLRPEFVCTGWAQK